MYLQEDKHRLRVASGSAPGGLRLGSGWVPGRSRIGSWWTAGRLRVSYTCNIFICLLFFFFPFLFLPGIDHYEQLYNFILRLFVFLIKCPFISTQFVYLCSLLFHSKLVSFWYSSTVKLVNHFLSFFHIILLFLFLFIFYLPCQLASVRYRFLSLKSSYLYQLPFFHCYDLFIICFWRLYFTLPLCLLYLYFYFQQPLLIPTNSLHWFHSIYSIYNSLFALLPNSFIFAIPIFSYNVSRFSSNT